MHGESLHTGQQSYIQYAHVSVRRAHRNARAASATELNMLAGILTKRPKGTHAVHLWMRRCVLPMRYRRPERRAVPRRHGYPRPCHRPRGTGRAVGHPRRALHPRPQRRPADGIRRPVRDAAAGGGAPAGVRPALPRSTRGVGGRPRPPRRAVQGGRRRAPRASARVPVGRALRVIDICARWGYLCYRAPFIFAMEIKDDPGLIWVTTAVIFTLVAMILRLAAVRLPQEAPVVFKLPQS